MVSVGVGEEANSKLLQESHNGLVLVCKQFRFYIFLID